MRERGTYSDADQMTLVSQNRKLEDEIASLKRELQAAKSFHDVAVRERDYERAVVNRLRAAVAAAQEALNSV